MMTLEVTETSDGPLWHVAYSSEGFQAFGVGITYLKSDDAMGSIDIADDQVANPEGHVEAPEILYWELEEGADVMDRSAPRTWYKARSGVVSLAPMDNGLRLRLEDVEFVPARMTYPEMLVVIDDEAMGEPRILSGEVTGRYEWTCLLADLVPDDDRSSAFCSANAP